MTGSEKDAIIGRLVREHQSVKEDLVCLQTKAGDLWKTFSSVANELRNISSSQEDLRMDKSVLKTGIDLGDAIKVLQEFHETSARLEEIRSKLGSLGIDKLTHY